MLELSNLFSLLYPCPSIYRVRLGVGGLEVYSSWWAWAATIWPDRTLVRWLEARLGPATSWFGRGTWTGIGLVRQETWTGNGLVRLEGFDSVGDFWVVRHVWFGETG